MKNKFVFLIVFIMTAFVVFLEANQKQPVNWYPTYHNNDKIPFGTYIFFEELAKKTPQLQEIGIPPYEALQFNDDIKSGTYFFVSESINFDKSEFSELLNWVKDGNQLFLSARNFSPVVLDTLEIEQKSEIQQGSLINYSQYNFVNPHLKSAKPYVFYRDQYMYSFKKIDTTKHKVLGKVSIKDAEKEEENLNINFIEIPFEKGKIFLHNAPEVFSNYFLLGEENQYEYTNKLMSYLDLDDNFYWDVYYSGGRTIYTSPLYVLLNNKYLKWAYYFTLIGLLFYVIFEGKRKQKSIPIVNPLENKTYEYVRTISNLYLDKKNHTKIAKKKIEQFFYFVRTHLRIDTQQELNRLGSEIAQKTNKNKDEVTSFLRYLTLLQQQNPINAQELVELNKKINDFKKEI
ncbi:DUF4350 domain-containing protein [Mesonia sp. K7]|uniref:DUF4350 domain-containing protein n=1 Tax=Mesonia sp. K7 TaxID=2218606 RepID=UPI000DA7A8D3|nr:DUF4350 domain-containing protein [Mesonia sp. K7]PZD77303.1 DUF4350 domain-containing protein [Mesonia sp. K7]